MSPTLFISCILLIVTRIYCSQNGFCTIDNCVDQGSGEVLVAYSVNPAEGFNLRRDVYLRMAGMVRRASPLKLKLVLPPWRRLYHWRRPHSSLPWSLFFDINSLNSYIPVVELSDVVGDDSFTFDRLYRLTHFKNPFEDGKFVDRWEINDKSSCNQNIDFWGYDIKVKNIECVAFQGSASKLTELIKLHPDDRSIMFTNAEIPLHDEYGTSEYWKARKSLKFNKDLINIANDFISDEFRCEDEKCRNFLSVHWRRGDFARGRRDQVPSVIGTSDQIVKKCLEIGLKSVFLATDADFEEFNNLRMMLISEGLDVRFYTPSDTIKSEFGEGGEAIIDQIICSRAVYFVGTHESTFTYRIQEEREIMGFDSNTTFNRLCPDNGLCERPALWRIVH